MSHILLRIYIQLHVKYPLLLSDFKLQVSQQIFHKYRIFSNLIRTSFCRFLKRKKKLVRGCNPHLWEDDGEDKDDSDWVTDSDWVMSDDGESGE